MVEITGDIRDYFGRGIVAITTNGFVSPSGSAVFGRGCARLARELFPDLPKHLGELLMERGNHVHYIRDGIVSFPVEESPWALPDLKLIRRSARELQELAVREGWKKVVVPRPGCGGGGLDWREVRPIVAEFFDDRFHLLTEYS